jgi:hypothetical protein
VALILKLLPRADILVGTNITVSLPEFRGSSRSTLSLISTRGSLLGFWDLATHSLILQVIQALPGGLQTAISVNASNGLQLPSYGHEANWPRLSIRLDDANGMLTHNTSIGVSPCIGFCSSKIDLGLPKAGYSSPLALTLMTSFNVTLGDYIDLYLKGFRTGNTGMKNVSLSGIEAQGLTATWIPNNQTIRFKVVSNSTLLVAGISNTLLVDRKSLVLLPTTVLERNEGGIGLSGSFQHCGNLSRRVVDGSGPVGIMNWSNISFGNPVAGETTEILVTFSCSSAIAPGDTVEVSLGGFTRGGDMPALRLSPSGMFDASWHEAQSFVSLTARGSWPAEAAVLFSIESSNGIRLPADGLRRNDSELRVYVNASAGPVVSVDVLDSPAIGAVVYSSISFKPAVPGNLSEITFTFSLNDAVKSDEVVFLQLPGFSSRSSNPSIVINGTRNWPFISEWWGSNATLSLIAVTTVPPGLYRVVISAGSGFHLPPSGLYEKDVSIRVGSNASSCPIYPRPVQRVEGVGFVYSALSFSAAQADTTTELTLSFSLKTRITAGGEPVVLYLPGFGGPKNASVGNGSWPYWNTTTSTPGRSLWAHQLSWSNHTKCLNITFREKVAAGSVITVHVPRQLGITLPTAGVTRGSGIRLRAYYNASSTYQSMELPIQRLQVIGVFTESSIGFFPAAAGLVSNVTLNFSLNVPVHKGEHIELYLPGFSGPSRRPLAAVPVPVASIPTGAVAAVWWPTRRVLQMTLLLGLPEGTLVIVAANSSVLRLPTLGLSATANQLTLSTDAIEGPVAGQRLRSVQPIAYISDSAIQFVSTDRSSSRMIGGDGSVVRFPPEYVLGPDAIGEQYLIGEQLMTVAAVHGQNVTMLETYSGAVVHSKDPVVEVKTPGFRRARYRSGSGTTHLTFVYRVRPGDNSSWLDLFDGLLYYPSAGDWIRRQSMSPFTVVERNIPLASSPRSLSSNIHLVIDTGTPEVVSVSTTKWDGTYAVGERIDVRVTFDREVTLKRAQVVPLVRLGVKSMDSKARFAVYDSGNETDSLTFIYTVQVGDVSFYNMKRRGLLDYYDYDQKDPSPIRTTYGNLEGYIRRKATKPLTDADVTLSSPGLPGSLSRNNTVVVDWAAPRVISVWSNASSYGTEGAVRVGAGEHVYIFVQFSRSVSLSSLDQGLPFLWLNTASTKRAAFYERMVSNRTLLFKYAVQAGDQAEALDLFCQCDDYTQTTYINLNGSVIANASLVLPRRGSVDSLAHNSRIVVDTRPPRVLRVWCLSEDGVYGPGEVLDIAVMFNAPVSVEGVPRLELSTGDSPCFALYHNGSGFEVIIFRYLVERGQGSSDLDYVSTRALDLNAGAILRQSTVPTTKADLSLPMPGHWGSLGFSSDIVVDPSSPRAVAARVPGGGFSYHPRVQTVDVRCGEGNISTAPFRLRYGDLLTACLQCNITVASLAAELAYGGVLVPRVYEAQHVTDGRRFLVELDDMRLGVQPLQAFPCSLSAFVQDEDTFVGVNRDFQNVYQTGVMPISLEFSSPVVVDGAPQLPIMIGDAQRRATYSAGSQVQYIDVGITARSPVTRGEFQLQYEDFVTDCIAWNLSDALQANSLRARLEELPEIGATGLKNVSGWPFQHGWRFAVTFTGADPGELRVAPSFYSYDCERFSPDDAVASIAVRAAHDFRYKVEEGSKLSLTVRPNMTVPSHSTISLLLSSDERIALPALGLPMDSSDFSITVSSDAVRVPETRFPIRSLPYFLASSLTFDNDLIGNRTSLTFSWQLSVNVTLGDVFNFSLPGFLVPPMLTSITLNGTHGGEFHCSWFAAAETLCLTSRDSLEAYSVVQVVVPSTAGIALPLTGLYAYSPGVTIAFSGQEGSVNPHNLHFLQPVGVVYAAVSYSPPEADAKCNITLAYETSSRLLIGDQVSRSQNAEV